MGIDIDRGQTWLEAHGACPALHAQGDRLAVASWKRSQGLERQVVTLFGREEDQRSVDRIEWGTERGGCQKHQQVAHCGRL